MTKPSVAKPSKVIPFVASLFQDEEVWQTALEGLVRRFGRLLKKSSLIPFEYTDYYTEEMGTGLRRIYVAFENRIDPSELCEIKQWTRQMEEKLALNGSRRVNLDPGYSNLSKVILATTKDAAHRIYLGCGIFAEVTLTFETGRFTPFPWTYPDYQTSEALLFFDELRAFYKAFCREPGEPLYVR